MTLLVEHMSRVANILIFTLLSSSIYTTFSVKNNVGDLKKQVIALAKKVRQEKEHIDIYRTELTFLTGAKHIDDLKKKLMPHLQVVSVEQIQTLNMHQAVPQFAQNTVTMPMIHSATQVTTQSKKN